MSSRQSRRPLTTSVGELLAEHMRENAQLLKAYRHQGLMDVPRHQYSIIAGSHHVRCINHPFQSDRVWVPGWLVAAVTLSRVGAFHGADVVDILKSNLQEQVLLITEVFLMGHSEFADCLATMSEKLNAEENPDTKGR